jgi:hypothetical protein
LKHLTLAGLPHLQVITWNILAALGAGMLWFLVATTGWPQMLQGSGDDIYASRCSRSRRSLRGPRRIGTDPRPWLFGPLLALALRIRSQFLLHRPDVLRALLRGRRSSNRSVSHLRSSIGHIPSSCWVMHVRPATGG